MALESDVILLVIHPSLLSFLAPPPAAAAMLERPEDASHSDHMVETNLGSNIGDMNDSGRRDRRSSRMILNWPGRESKSMRLMVTCGLISSHF